MTGQNACSQCTGISTGLYIQGMIADHDGSVGFAAQPGQCEIELFGVWFDMIDIVTADENPAIG